MRGWMMSSEILGTSITWLFSHLRHRSIENLHKGADGVCMHHGVRLDPLLPASDFRQRCWPAPPGSSSNSWKRSGWEGVISRISAVNCVSFLPSPTLAILGPRGAVWCFISARAIATVIRSCRSHERSRRYRRLIAAPAACSSLPRNDHVKSITNKSHTQTRATLE